MAQDPGIVGNYHLNVCRERVPCLFLRWVLKLHDQFAGIDPFPVSIATLLGYWHLHYFNMLAPLSKAWRQGLMDSFNRFSGAACKLYLHCRRTGQCPRLMVCRDPWCQMCQDSRDGRVQAGIARQMLFLQPRNKPITVERPPLCIIKYDAGLTIIGGRYPPLGHTIAPYHHTSVPRFHRKGADRRRTTSVSPER